MKKTLILWLDACCLAYLESMPFLSKLAQTGSFGYLQPVIGYNSILASFMTGFYPLTHQQFAAYCLADRKDKIGQDKILTFMPRFIAPYYFNLRRYRQGNDFPVAYVPYKYSKDFKVAQDKFYHHRNLYPFKTLLDILDDNNLKFIFYNWPFIYQNQGQTKLQFSLKNNDQNRIKKFRHLVQNNKADVYFLHLWDLDKYGHQLGPDSAQLLTHLRLEDELIKEVLKEFSRQDDNIIIWSDHGMLPVVKTIDIMKELPVSVHYQFFIDSTMARFWFNDEQGKREILDILNKFSDQGHFLTSGEKDGFKINFDDNKFGQEIFLVKPGVLICPNFFQTRPIKGMHGYDLSNKDEWGIFVSNCFVANELKVVDLLPIILKLLAIKEVDL